MVSFVGFVLIKYSIEGPSVQPRINDLLGSLFPPPHLHHNPSLPFCSVVKKQRHFRDICQHQQPKLLLWVECVREPLGEQNGESKWIMGTGGEGGRRKEAGLWCDSCLLWLCFAGCLGLRLRVASASTLTHYPGSNGGKTTQRFTEDPSSWVSKCGARNFCITLHLGPKLFLKPRAFVLV